MQTDSSFPSMKRHLNNLKKFFDGSSGSLSERSNKDNSLVLRAKSTSDVLESEDERPALPETDNR